MARRSAGELCTQRRRRRSGTAAVSPAAAAAWTEAAAHRTAAACSGSVACAAMPAPCCAAQHPLASGPTAAPHRRLPQRAWVGVLQWDRSAATPATLATSYRDSSDTRRFILSSRDRGWPMPPPAPSTVTLLRDGGREGAGSGQLVEQRGEGTGGSPGGASARRRWAAAGGGRRIAACRAGTQSLAMCAWAWALTGPPP